MKERRWIALLIIEGRVSPYSTSGWLSREDIRGGSVWTILRDDDALFVAQYENFERIITFRPDVRSSKATRRQP